MWKFRSGLLIKVPSRRRVSGEERVTTVKTTINMVLLGLRDSKRGEMAGFWALVIDLGPHTWAFQPPTRTSDLTFDPSSKCVVPSERACELGFAVEVEGWKVRGPRSESGGLRAKSIFPGFPSIHGE